MMKKTVIAASVFLTLATGVGAGDAIAHQFQNSNAGRDPVEARHHAQNTTFIAQPITQVNTTTAGEQAFRAVGALEDGGYTVVWETTTNDPANGRQYFLQRFDSGGRKVGGEVFLPIAVLNSTVAVLSNGNVVFAYSGDRNTLPNSPPVESDAFFQIFDASGNRIRGETVVNSAAEKANGLAPNSLATVWVTALADGDFVVDWVKNRVPSVQTYFNQSYDSTGQRIGHPVVLLSDATEEAGYTVQTDPEGGFLLYKNAIGLGGPCDGIRAQSRLTSVIHFDENLATEQLVEPTACVFVIPLEGSNFMRIGNASSGGPYSQLLDRDGNAIGPQKQIATATEFLDLRFRNIIVPIVLADGGYVLFWRTDAGAAIAQRFDSTGDAIGGRLSIETVRTFGSRGLFFNVVALENDGFTFAWGEGGPESDVFSQQFSEAADRKHAGKHANKKMCFANAYGLKGEDRKAFLHHCIKFSPRRVN